MSEHSGIFSMERLKARIPASLRSIQAHPDDDRSSSRAWRIVAASIGALLLAIVLAGVLAINENNRVSEITTRAISFDLEVEDEGDDLRIAVLDLRHYHRNFLFGDVSPAMIADFDDAYAALLEELAELESIGLSEIGFDQPARIRELAERYYTNFRPALDRATDDPRAFQTASDVGLSRLASKDDSLHATSLSAIAAETQRMGKLVDDLLFLARSDAGSPPLDREYVPARWLVSRLVKTGEMLARQHDSCLAHEIAGEGYLDVDPERIEQAILILIDNAARHSPAGACVTLASRVEGQWLTVAVADTGAGITPEELPLIFDRFYQLKNRRSRKKSGSGLGLSIARSIVAAHGGSIVAESRLGEGTRMMIRLPMALPPDMTERPPGVPHQRAVR